MSLISSNPCTDINSMTLGRCPLSIFCPREQKTPIQSHRIDAMGLAHDRNEEKHATLNSRLFFGSHRAVPSRPNQSRLLGHPFYMWGKDSCQVNVDQSLFRPGLQETGDQLTKITQSPTYQSNSVLNRSFQHSRMNAFKAASMFVSRGCACNVVYLRK